MYLKDLAYTITVDNRKKGFGFDVDDKAQLGAKLMLAVGELAEAYEEIRDGLYGADDIYYHGETSGFSAASDDALLHGGVKLEGFPVEIADCIIRLLQICGEAGINIDAVIAQKLAYNRTRPHKHGGKII